jgi:chorismate mutase/prephenate dehydratase
VKEKLSPIRERIDAIDVEITVLLNERAQLARQIGDIKATASAPIHEPTREEQVLGNVERIRREPLDRNGLEKIYVAIMEVMRRLQQRA